MSVDRESGAVRALLGALDEAVWVCAGDGLIDTANPAAVALSRSLGWTEPKAGDALERWLGAAVAGPVAAGLRRALAEGGMAEGEVQLDHGQTRRTLAWRWRVLPGGPDTAPRACLVVNDLSGRRATEQALDVLRRALDGIAEGVVVADLDQRAIYFNRAFERLAAQAAQDQFPMGPGPTGTGATVDLRAAIRRQLASARPFVGEIEGRDGDGQPYWHEIVVTPLVDEVGQVTHFVGVREDITGRKQLERSLEENRSRLQAVITTAMDGIVSFDEQHRVVMINRAAAAMFRWDEDAALGQPLGALIPAMGDPAQLDSLRPADVASASPAGVGRLGEILARRADGEEFPVEVSLSQVQVHGRQLFTAILRDISARRQAEHVLQASQRRFKSIFEHSIDGILLTDDAGNYIDANPAACRVFGYQRDEIVGRSLREVLVLPEGQGFAALWDEFLRTGSAQGEFHLRRKDGTTVLVEHNAIAHILSGLHLTIIRDVSERQALQEQLLRQQRLDSVGRLASGLAHDLNNILTPILMVPGMLRGRLHDAASLNLLDMLEQGARRGAAIIEQLLTFAREIPGERKIQHLGALAETATRLMRETFPKNIDLDLRVEPQAWPFLGDATQVQQLVLNLAMNAKDAMRNGGRLTIAVTNEQVSPDEARATPGAKAGPHVVLSVADTGHGIEPQHIGRIFDPFFTTKPLGEATGLGLSSALGIVRHHGGFITVRSRPQRGAIFRVFLPAVGVEALASPDAPVTPARGGGGQVVLVVDDEEDVRTIARQLLSGHGYAVICAKDGESALAQLKAADQRVDLVLTDLAMPGMGGERLVSTLRRRNPGLRIVVMTGHDPSGSVAAGRVPAHGYVRKPFSGDELLRTLASVRGAPSAEG